MKKIAKKIKNELGTFLIKSENMKFKDFVIENQIFKDHFHELVSAGYAHSKAKFLLRLQTSSHNESQNGITAEAEIKLFQSLKHSGILDVSSDKPVSEHAIVFEHFEGMALSDYLENKVISLHEFFNLASQLTNILAHLHQNKIIHSDFRPDNFLINNEFGTIKLFNLNTAHLEGEAGTAINYQQLKGNKVLFLSPEQTGRLSKPIDKKTDFYSLGVLFYKMLTNKAPVVGKDNMEYVHGHIAIRPLPPKHYNNEIPPMLNDIIMKLLEKSPEKRYQIAQGLIHDLSVCAMQWSTNGSIDEFELGRNDISDTFQVAGHLIGRASELQTMAEIFEKVSLGSAELILVKGFSGIGKSALVYEARKKMKAKNFYFVVGKFDQLHRDKPYRAGIEAFKSIVKQILSESDEQLVYWRERLLERIGQNIQVFIDVIPDLKLVVGEQPPLIALDPAATEKRFLLTYLKFVQALSSAAHPLIIFLDDLQWADLPSLKLVDILLTDPDTQHIVIIGAYRDNEVGPTGALMTTIRSIIEKQVKVTEITLDALTHEEINMLTAASLHNTEEKTRELANIIFVKTGGNPFFVKEFLKSLYDRELIWFDHQKSQWIWNTSDIDKQQITDNVVDLMRQRLGELPPATQELVQYASCIGNNFHLSTLSIISDKSKVETAMDLWPAIQEGLVVSQGNISGLEESKFADTTYKFLHDRVQQAAYLQISEEVRRQLHLKIGRQMLNNMHEDQWYENIYDLTDQFTIALPDLTDRSEKRQIANLLFIGGQRAKSSASFEAADKYLTSGLSLMDEDSWLNDYSLTLVLHNQGAEAAYLNGDFDRMMDITGEVIRRSHDKLDTVQSYIIRSQAYVSLSNNLSALQTILEGLEVQGVHFPGKPNKLHVLKNLLQIKWAFRGKTEEQLAAMPEMTDKKSIAVMELLSGAASPAYFANQALFPLIVFEQLKMSAKYGNHKQSAFAYATYGVVLAGNLKDYKEAWKFGSLANHLMEVNEAGDLIAKIRFVFTNFIKIYRDPFLQNIHENLEGFEKGIDAGDYLYGGYCAFGSVTLPFYQGSRLQKIGEDAGRRAATLQKLNQEMVFQWVNIHRQAIYNLTEKKERHTMFEGPIYDESVRIPTHISGNDFSGLTAFYVHKILFAYLFRQYDVGIEFGQEAGKTMESLLATAHHTQYHFYFGMCLARYAGGSALIRPKLRKQLLKQCTKNISALAREVPANFGAKDLILRAVQSEAKLETRLALLEESLVISKEQNSFLDQAMAYELCGILCYEAGQKENAGKYFQKARLEWQRWGAYAKVAAMDNDQMVRDAMKAAGLYTTVAGLVVSPDDAGGTFNNLDIHSLMKASTALTGEVALHRLHSEMMKVAVENAGAQKGHLVVQRDDRWVIVSSGATALQADGAGQNISLDDNKLVPVSVVNYVIRTGEVLVIDDVRFDQRFANDPVVVHNNLSSVLCLPIKNQGRLMGVLYMENNLHANVFNEHRVEFLQLLGGQLGVSLENAFLFENLEQKVVERTREIVRQKDEIETEKQKVDSLLLNVLPLEIAEELKTNGMAIPKRFENVSVMFTDFVRFSKISENMNPEELIDLLNFYYSNFDNIISKYRIEKIKTIGDSYMCVSGLPMPYTDHAMEMTHAALEIRDFIVQANEDFRQSNRRHFECRIGIHSGSVIAGIVGTKKFAYDIWGNTVNIASRMENSAENGKVNISGQTKLQLNDIFTVTHRGEIEAKNIGAIEMYYVDY